MNLSLQQSGTFSSRPGISLEAEGLGGFPELLFVAFILLPGDIRRMGVANQHVPLVSRQPLVTEPAIGLLAPAATAKGVGSGVPRIVDRTAGAAQRQGDPGQFILVRAGGHPRREKQVLLPEVLDGSA